MFYATIRFGSLIYNISNQFWQSIKNKRKKDTTHHATSSKRKKSKPTNKKKTPKPLKRDSNTIEGIEESIDQLQNAEKHGEDSNL